MDLTEKIIENVKRQPCLYDMRDKRYKNNDYKTQIWNSLTELVGFDGTGSDLAAKWKSIRDNYTHAKKRLRKKKRSTGSAAEDYESTWPYFELMRWLDEFTKDRSSRESNLSQQRIPSPSLSPEVACSSQAYSDSLAAASLLGLSSVDDRSKAIEDKENEPTGAQYNEKSSSTRKQKRKKRNINADEDDAEEKKEIAQLTKSMLEVDKLLATPESDMMVFAKHIGRQLEGMPIYQQQLAQIKIQTALFECQQCVPTAQATPLNMPSAIYTTFTPPDYNLPL